MDQARDAISKGLCMVGNWKGRLYKQMTKTHSLIGAVVGRSSTPHRAKGRDRVDGGRMTDLLDQSVFSEKGSFKLAGAVVQLFYDLGWMLTYI